MLKRCGAACDTPACDTPGCTRKTAAPLITRASEQPAPCTQPVKRFYRLNARRWLAEGYVGPVVIKAVAACQIYPDYLLHYQQSASYGFYSLNLSDITILFFPYDPVGHFG